MADRFDAALAVLPERLGWHVALSASALVLGLAIALPLGIAAARSPRLKWVALGGAGLVQTIPSLALLALFYPVLLLLSGLAERVFGQGFSALGFLPSLLALTLYSMLPILRNAAAGVSGIDPAVVEAARGVGMTDRQRLWRVELPLAAPVIMAGVRTAAVWTIGAATLSTPVGQTSLGDYIFSGLQTEDWVAVLVGCAASAGLAIVVDALLGLIEAGVARRDGKRFLAGGAGLAIGLLAALAPLAVGALAQGRPAYVIGAKNFSEQYILAELMAGRLEREGASVQRRVNLGSAVAYRALAAGEIDAYVDYSGTLWANVLNRKDNPGRQAVLEGLRTELEARDGVVLLAPLGFENAYALAMRRDRAEALGIKSLADLAARAPDLTMGGDLEFFSRPEWAAVVTAYGLRFKAERQFQPTFMYRALESREADVISAFSSDGRIAADDLVLLTDPRGALPPYDAVILVSPKRAGDRRLIEALKPLGGSIDVRAMQAANYAVDRDAGKKSPAEAAAMLAR
ncbi:ABC transporter permease [Caulobacter segnis]|uniref:Substrate-binding region of ABC-type glycine betaine transport system n=2 Tax=Caulobacter segnis TaxID=88688 RepID=D5VMP4_CAUST|nr:glycine betaine ABC transporter substrate-binding protein [Caulobacter segnis]ADG11767.1 Substrate-binding region of ABC-type glycine betaine transport system [Caulobacter segnis ATCC 21756]AVQ03407.1 ABC transporter permease [Caulobacter segnis]